MRKLAFISVIVVAMTAAAVIERGAVTITSAQSRTPRYGFWGVALDARDLTVKPGDDFFRHVNGVWYDKTEIPADKSSIGLATILADEVELQVRAIVEDSVKSQDPAAKQLAAFWASWMDEAGIEARGNKALEPYLANVAAVQTRDDLLRLFTDPGYTAPIDVFIRPDPGQPNRYIAFATQGGLGMPNRDYYLREGENTRACVKPTDIMSSECRRLLASRMPKRRLMRSWRLKPPWPSLIGHPNVAATLSRPTIQ